MEIEIVGLIRDEFNRRGLGLLTPLERETINGCEDFNDDEGGVFNGGDIFSKGDALVDLPDALDVLDRFGLRPRFLGIFANRGELKTCS